MPKRLESKQPHSHFNEYSSLWSNLSGSTQFIACVVDIDLNILSEGACHDTEDSSRLNSTQYYLLSHEHVQQKDDATIDFLFFAFMNGIEEWMWKTPLQRPHTTSCRWKLETPWSIYSGRFMKMTENGIWNDFIGSWSLLWTKTI